MTGPRNKETPGRLRRLANQPRISNADARVLHRAADELESERAACVRAEEALRDARRYCESYCEATDPDPREDDGEEITVASAYVLSAMLAIDEGLAAVGDNKPPEECRGCNDPELLHTCGAWNSRDPS